MRSRLSARRGFTLIELLVVIAIIAILAAILFPVFSRARESARKASCQSNLKQIGLGVTMYNQDYDEKYPMSSYMLGSCVSTMDLQIAPYVKSQQLNQCPSEPQAFDTTGSFAAIGLPACPGVPQYSSYSVNQSLIVNGFIPGNSPRSLASVQAPAETVMIYDGNVDGTRPMQRQLVQARHNGVLNAAYADGHVKALTAGESGAATQFISGKPLKEYRLGASAGFYRNMVECQTMP